MCNSCRAPVQQDSDHDGKDCLEVACYRGRLHIVQWLVERFGGLANIPNKAGNHPCQASIKPPLHQIVFYGSVT